jgi:hypothetical protein
MFAYVKNELDQSRFKPVITNAQGQELTFPYKRTLFRCLSCGRGNLCIVTSLRFIYLFVLLFTVAFSAGFYHMDKKTFNLPNDGDPVNWILRFGNINAVMVMVYFLVAIVSVRIVARYENVSNSQILKFLQILYTIVMPLTCLSLTEYFSKITTDAHVIMGEEVTIIVTFIVMVLDFSYGTQYLDNRWVIYPLAVVNAYLNLLGIIAFVGGVTVYPALPFIENPMYAIFQCVVVHIVCALEYFVIAYITQWRYRKYVDGVNISNGAHRHMTYNTKNNELTKDTVDVEEQT